MKEISKETRLFFNSFIYMELCINCHSEEIETTETGQCGIAPL